MKSRAPPQISVRVSAPGNVVEPLSKGHFGTDQSVHCWEVVLFSEEWTIAIWESGPDECPHLGDRPFPRGSFVGGSTVAITNLIFLIAATETFK